MLVTCTCKTIFYEVSMKGNDGTVPLEFHKKKRKRKKKTASVMIGFFLCRCSLQGKTSRQKPRTKQDTSSPSRRNLSARLPLRDGSSGRGTSCHPCFKNADPFSQTELFPLPFIWVVSLSLKQYMRCNSWTLMAVRASRLSRCGMMNTSRHASGVALACWFPDLTFRQWFFSTYQQWCNRGSVTWEWTE